MLTDRRHRSIDQPRRLRVSLVGSLVLAASVAVSGGAAYAQDAEAPSESSPAPAASPAASTAASTSAAGIDGTWTIDTEIGDFADYSSSWVGFRVAEVLQQLGDVDAVGRTPSVSGTLVAEGTTIENAVIEVDLTTITSDQPRRDPAIGRALDTASFPTATLEMREPLDLGAVPAEGVPFSAAVPGRLTIHGVSQDVDLQLTGQRVGDIVVVVGSLPIDFTSFGITMPTAPIVLSVEDTGDLEFQLYLSREAAPATEGGTEEG